MSETNDIYSDEEEPTPEWVFELQKEMREYMEEFQVEATKISAELNELKAGTKMMNELMDSSNALRASAAARMQSANALLESSNVLMASSNALIKSSNTKIESLTLEKKLALEKLNEIEQAIDETKTCREETDKYWKDLIKKEIKNRSECRRGPPRKTSSSKFSTKRLNNNGDDHKHAQTKKKKKN